MADTDAINPLLEQAIEQLLKDVAMDKGAEIEARLKVIACAINLAKLKAKMSEEEYGAGFYKDDAPEA